MQFTTNESYFSSLVLFYINFDHSIIEGMVKQLKFEDIFNTFCPSDTTNFNADLRHTKY